MNETIKAIILGIVQGLSEFLPISSSGHLVLFQEILDFNPGGLAFEVFVHFGTLIAVVIVFRDDIWQMLRYLPGVPAFIMSGFKVNSQEDQYRAMTTFIVIGSIPAGLIGIFFKDNLEQLFNSTALVLLALFFTGLILFSARFTRENPDRKFMNIFHAIIIGFAQAFAIIPGISRSGSTIVTGLWMGLGRDLTARFSFLLSAPVILGATLLQTRDLVANPPAGDELFQLLAATVAAAVSGYLAIIWMLDIIKRQRLEWFGLYCVLVSAIGAYLIY